MPGDTTVGTMSRPDVTIASTDADPDHRSCNGCGSHVSHSFARVFGTNGNEVHACPNCASLRELYGSSAHTDGGTRPP